MNSFNVFQRIALALVQQLFHDNKLQEDILQSNWVFIRSSLLVVLFLFLAIYLSRLGGEFQFSINIFWNYFNSIYFILQTVHFMENVLLVFVWNFYWVFLLILLKFLQMDRCGECFVYSVVRAWFLELKTSNLGYYEKNILFHQKLLLIMDTKRKRRSMKCRT